MQLLTGPAFAKIRARVEGTKLGEKALEVTRMAL
jgi:hypothetical protein